MVGYLVDGTRVIRWDDVPVYLHREPVDFRKSINGLVLLVEQDMSMSPFEKCLFVFGCRRRDKIKVLYWDKTGFCLWYKRLEKAKFKWPRQMKDDIIFMRSEQFDWLLRGFDLSKLTPHQEMFYSEVA